MLQRNDYHNSEIEGFKYTMEKKNTLLSSSVSWETADSDRHTVANRIPIPSIIPPLNTKDDILEKEFIQVCVYSIEV